VKLICATEFSDIGAPALHQPKLRTSAKGTVPSGSKFGGSHMSLLKTALTTRASQNQDSNIGNIANEQPQVVHFDSETGKGLRKWLFKSGKDNGMMRKALGSVSFHDFTPDIMTGKFSNTLLGHYTNEKPGSKVEVYEVKL
jgi:hypothetical protein